MKKLCLSLDLAFPLKLFQEDKDKFTVKYGKQITKNLSYGRALAEYEECIIHALVYDSFN